MTCHDDDTIMSSFCLNLEEMFNISIYSGFLMRQINWDLAALIILEMAGRYAYAYFIMPQTGSNWFCSKCWY